MLAGCAVSETERGDQKMAGPVAKQTEAPRTLASYVNQAGESRAAVPYLGPDDDSPMAVYSGALIERITQRWHGLRDKVPGKAEESGKVVVGFRLHNDGRISDIAVKESTVSEVASGACKKAVKEAGPLDPWPEDMSKKLAGKSHHDVTFTFLY